MTPYPHVDTLFKRDAKNKIIVGQITQPEFEYLKDLPWRWTEKVDGTNIRVMFSAASPGWYQSTGLAIYQHYNGRTDNAQMPSGLVQYLTDTFRFTQDNLHEIFRVGEAEVFPDVCLYGEGYGAGIQKVGSLYGPTKKFVLFDVKIGNTWLTYDNVVDIAFKMGIDVVPTRYICNIPTAISFVQGGFKSNWGDFNAEGLVGQPLVSLFNRRGGRIITKIKTVDFEDLLK
jgi:hypothetical protein